MSRRGRGGGFDKAFLEELGEKATAAAINALEEGAKLVVAQAKTNANTSKKTGALQESIHYEVQNKGRRIKIVADAKNDKGIPYGPFVEFVHGKPFLFPAIDSKRAAIKEMIIAAIKEADRNAKR